MDSLSSKSKSTAMTSEAGHMGIDMAAMMASSADLDRKRKVSMSYATDADGQPIGLPLDLFIFSDTVKLAREGDSVNPINEFSTKHQLPDTKQFPKYESGKMLGYTPLTSEFHMESNRERQGPLDDGLDDEDLTAADGIIRKQKGPAVKRRSIIYDNIQVTKGEFTFPYRTYRPKVQVAYQGSTGQIPQAVVVERLHRLYKKTDINLVLQTLGIEPADLVPPPNYGETNERYYQEMMFRNRTRVNGIDKKEFILSGNNSGGENEGHDHHLHAPKDDDSVSYPSSSSNSKSSTSATSSDFDSEEADEEEEEKAKAERRNRDHNRGSSVHPFIKAKSPFGPMFPIHCFDNGEFDIRKPEEWIHLGWDTKERRFNPLPGKAFLPLPGTPAKKKSLALSQTTVDSLLTSTPRLEKLYQWLLRERYKRTVKADGDDPSKAKRAPTEMDLTLLARLGSTVQGLFKDSSSNVWSKLAETKSKMIEDSNMSIVNILSNQEISGEVSTESSSDPKKLSAVMTNGGQMLPLYNIVYKQWVSKKLDEEGSSVDLEENQIQKIDDVASIPGEGSSEMQSLTLLEEAEEEDETFADDIEEDTDDKEWSGSKNFLIGENGPVRPSSPDTDVLTDGHEKYVYDFDKMKKVHVYDWKWVDVAVFDHDPETDRFYVRSIHPPIIHAWVDKIYLCFDAEDPNRHGHRIRDAFIRRAESENCMRFNLYIDCLPVENIASINDKVMDTITKKSLSAPRIKFTDNSLFKAKKEIDLEFKRTMARSKFEYITEKHMKMYRPWVLVPEPEKAQDPEKESKKMQEVSIPQQNFQYRVKKIQKLSVIYTKEPFEALRRINEICLEAKAKTMILVDNLEPLHLDEWERRQKENIAELRRYLQNEWYQAILDTLKEHLGKIPQSWYNLKEMNYDVFVMSKLSNFLTLVKMFMEDTLRSIVVDSIEKFIVRTHEVSKECDLSQKFTWDPEDLITSRYPTPKNVSPIWVLELYMDNDSPKYSQFLRSFNRIASTIFNETIKAVKDLPALLPQIMPQMQFASHGCLQSPDESKPEFKRMKAQLQRYIKLSLLPIDSYVQLFKKYQEIWNLDIASFIKDWEAENHTAEEVQELVENHMKHAEEVEKEIPHEIHITGFRIIVDVVREGILKKKKTLFNTILGTYANKLKKIMLKVRDEYVEIDKKLNTRSDDIEEVMELKIYVEGVTSIVTTLEETTTQVIKDYEIFDKFMYPIPNDDFNAKWQAAVFSGKILKMTKDAVKWLNDDYERLLKVQMQDLGTLSDQVDSASLSVAGLVGFIDLDKASDVAQEVKKIWKTVKELDELGELLNTRQVVFGLPPTQNEALKRLVKDIEPFKNLWFIAADWLKIQESVFGGTLENVDIDGLVKVTTDGRQVIEDCIEYFSGADQIQHIASTIEYQIDNFKPLVPLIRTLKNIGMRQRHWEAISDICGFPVVAKGNQNFKKLQEQGIQKYVNEISEIENLATKEYTIEMSLDKMAIGITYHHVKLTTDEDTKQPIISLQENTLSTVSEYIGKTEEIKNNPFNKPFEERLAVWDKKINNAKENIELWFVNQDHWLRLEPIFRNPDIATRLPVEYKMFEKLQRIWRRIIRCARNTPDIIDLASDTTVIASLSQFSALVVKIGKAMEEHQKPKRDSDSDD